MPRWSDVIELVPLVEDTNSVGDPVMVDGEPRRVYANRRSVRQSEFYQAMQTGLRPELMFEVRSIDYDDEPKVRYGGHEYAVIRAYDKGEVTELVLGGLVGDG